MSTSRAVKPHITIHRNPSEEGQSAVEATLAGYFTKGTDGYEFNFNCSLKVVPLNAIFAYVPRHRLPDGEVQQLNVFIELVGQVLTIPYPTLSSMVFHALSAGLRQQTIVISQMPTTSYTNELGQTPITFIELRLAS